MHLKATLIGFAQSYSEWAISGISYYKGIWHEIKYDIILPQRSANITFDFTNQVEKHSYTNAIDLKFCMQLCDINSDEAVYFWVITWNNDIIERQSVENESTS